MTDGATSKVAGGGGGLEDILSMALMQTGVDSVPPAQISMDSSCILSAAANTLDSSLLSTDIGVLTEGLLSTLAMAKGNTTAGKPPTVNTSTRSSNSAGLSVVTSQPGVSVAPPLCETTPSSLAPSEKLTTPEVAIGKLDTTVVPTQSSPLPLTLARPPSESEVKTAQILRAELHSSCMDDDIDLDELLSVGDNMNTEMGHLEGSATTLQTVSSNVPQPPASNQFVGSSSNTNTSSTDDDLSSLLNMAGTQYLESLDPQLVSDTEQSVLAGQTSSARSTDSVYDVPSIVNLLTSTTVATTSAPPSLLTKSTTSNTPLTPLIPTMSVTPTPTTSPAAPSTNVTHCTKSTPTTTTSLPQKKPVLPTTKLDIAAILKEVTQTVPKSSSALTNTVSVTVVPSAAIENVLRSLKSQGRISAVPLVSRAPHVIQRYELQTVVEWKLLCAVREKILCVYINLSVSVEAAANFHFRVMCSNNCLEHPRNRLQN